MAVGARWSTRPAKPPVVKSKSQEKIDEVQNEMYHESARYREKKPRPPWIGEDGKTVIWSPFRIALAKVVFSQLFEAGMGFVIFFNLIIIVYETDQNARCYPDYYGDVSSCPYEASKIVWLKFTGWFLLIVYTGEAIIRLFVERLAYFKNVWNDIDITVVGFGWIGELMAGGGPDLAFLRIFRMTRLVRVVRFLVVFPELNSLVRSLDNAMKAIFFGSIMLFGIISIFSIVLVIFIHPISSRIGYGDCERCPRGFATVMGSSLTLFQQIVTGDSWGTISVPLIEAAPWTAPFVIGVFFIIGVGLMNLILAVIVESATDESFEKLEDKAREKATEIVEAKIALLKMFAAMDEDDNGIISQEELQKGYKENEAFASSLKLMEVNEDDLQSIFKTLDANNNGEVDYFELCNELYRLQSRDYRMVLTQIKVRTSEIFMELKESLGVFKTHAERQSQLMETMSTKLDQLCRGGHTTDKVDKFISGSQLPPEPSAWSQAFPSAQLTQEFPKPDVQAHICPTLEFCSLQKCIEELMTLESGIVMDVEQHLIHLKQQADQVCKSKVESSDTVASGASRSDMLPAWEHLEHVGEMIGRLRIGVRQQLTKLLKDFEQKMDDRAQTTATKCGLGDGPAVVGRLLSIYWNDVDELPNLPPSAAHERG